MAIKVNKFTTLTETLAASASTATLTSAAFDNGTKVPLILEYDSSSKLEVILADVSGTALTNIVRAQDGTSDIEHTGTPKIGQCSSPSTWKYWLEVDYAGGGWQDIRETVTCGGDNVLTISATGYGAVVAVGDKIWVDDDGTDWMGYVTAKDATSATVIGGTTAGAAATIASGSTITNAKFSKAASPVGFPHAFATAIGFVRFEGGTMIQYGKITITCASGSDNAAGTINFPTELNFADTDYTFTVSGARSPSFATVNEMAFTCHSTHTEAQAVITLFARAGTWAANRSPVVYWRAEGKI